MRRPSKPRMSSATVARIAPGRVESIAVSNVAVMIVPSITRLERFAINVARIARVVPADGEIGDALASLSQALALSALLALLARRPA